ncbi:transducin beta-like protein 3 [Tanacetum coccineum]
MDEIMKKLRSTQKKAQDMRGEKRSKSIKEAAMKSKWLIQDQRELKRERRSASTLIGITVQHAVAPDFRNLQCGDAVTWNANGVVILLQVIVPRVMKGVWELLEGLIPYSQRHYIRIDRFERSTLLLLDDPDVEAVYAP